MKTALYRMWGNDGQLLYVGISKSALGRLGQHLTEKSWAADIVNVTIETFPTREQAAAAEVAAIKTEKPLHNVTHNVNKRLIHPSKHSYLTLQGTGEAMIKSVKIGDYVALGMHSGKCPIGQVTKIDQNTYEPSLYIDLRHPVTGWYGNPNRSFCLSEIDWYVRLIQIDELFNDSYLVKFQSRWLKTQNEKIQP